MKSKCIVAHPDDEVIFMGAFLRTKKSIIETKEQHPDPHSVCITKVACMTCQDDEVRAKEFEKICEYYKFDGSIYDLRITRSFVNANVIAIWGMVSGELDKQTDCCITHALYGDDHFHPQHMLISTVCLSICLARRIPIIFSHSSKSYKWLFSSAINRTEFTLKSLFFLVVKLMMIGLTGLLTRYYCTARAQPADLNNAIQIYSSQSLSYINVIENKFNFRVLRSLFKNRIRKNDLSLL